MELSWFLKHSSLLELLNSLTTSKEGLIYTNSMSI